MHVSKSLDSIQGVVGRNVDIKDVFSEISDGNEEHVIKHWRKVAKDLVELCSSVM